jgi:hypothetical protein
LAVLNENPTKNNSSEAGVNLNKIINKVLGTVRSKVLKIEDLKSTNIENPGRRQATTEGAPIKVHMFWAYGDLTMLEKLAALSFIANGFELRLWTYGEITNLPKGINQYDARKVLPEDRVFKYKNGSYAGFADLFRYAVLCQQGGLWADTDVVCLASATDFRSIAEDGLLVTERTPNSIQMNCNLIYHPKPTAGDIIDLAHTIADRYQVEKLEWGDCGPKLLTTLVKAYPKITPKIMSPEFAKPVNHWDCPNALLDESKELPKETWFLHCFNEMWRRSGTNKNNPYPSNSILGKVFALYEDQL